MTVPEVSMSSKSPTPTPILSVSLTEAGRRHAAELPFEHVHGDLAATVSARWAQVDGLVLFCATGIAVRVIAPLLSSKAADPAVVVVDEAARHAIALCGGHGAGANALARHVSELLGAEPVVTTATDRAGVVAYDQLRGFTPSGDVAGVTRAVLDGSAPVVDIDEHLRRSSPSPWTPPGVVGGDGPHRVVVSDLAESGLQAAETETSADQPATLVLCPETLVVGVGASTNAPADAAEALLTEALAAAGLNGAAIGVVATIDRRASDPVVTSLGAPVRSFTGVELSEVSVPNPSDVVAAEVGTASVAEAAALLAAGPGAELVVEKVKGATATVAIARRARPEGKVLVVGLGPGDACHRTQQATAAVRHADVVIGYRLYVDQCAELTSPHQEVVRSPIGAEIDRCEEAVRRAGEGQRVALVCSGDPGVFAMATLVLEVAPKYGSPPVKVVPGVTASLAASSILGAPLAHDHALISLSDLLTPWPLIERRVQAVAAGDMAVAFYNPRSQRRTTQLVRAVEILLQHRAPTTPVGVVVNATRPDERVHLRTLGTLDPAEVDMFSIVVVGSSTTQLSNGVMVTPRGYDA